MGNFKRFMTDILTKVQSVLMDAEKSFLWGEYVCVSAAPSHPKRISQGVGAVRFEDGQQTFSVLPWYQKVAANVAVGVI